MKRYLFFICLLISVQNVFSQEPADALRYSWITSGGSARQQAIGGAMTSLGGDISATFVNPAGLGFYRTGDIVITPGYNFLNNKSTYLSRTETDKKNNMSFGATGVVLGTGMDNRKKDGSGVAISFASFALFSQSTIICSISYIFLSIAS